MAFRDFLFPDAVEQLGLRADAPDLFDCVPPMELSPEFAESIRFGYQLATNISTAKAMSEFVIAPVLLHLAMRHRGEFSLFSGVPLTDGLMRPAGDRFDFLLCRSPIQMVPVEPLTAVALAANGNPLSGSLGACLAGMVAIRDLRANLGLSGEIYCVSTGGYEWRFARLIGDELSIDAKPIFLADLGKILGILASIVRRPEL